MLFTHQSYIILSLAQGFNGDDVLLAREALKEVPAGRLLDLGAGTGSVGLLWLAQAKAHLTALEAQEETLDAVLRQS